MQLAMLLLHLLRLKNTGYTHIPRQGKSMHNIINLVTQLLSIQIMSVLDGYVTNVQREIFAHNFAAVVC